MAYRIRHTELRQLLEDEDDTVEEIDVPQHLTLPQLQYEFPPKSHLEQLDKYENALRSSRSGSRDNSRRELWFDTHDHWNDYDNPRHIEYYHSSLDEDHSALVDDDQMTPYQLPKQASHISVESSLSSSSCPTTPVYPRTFLDLAVGKGHLHEDPKYDLKEHPNPKIVYISLDKNSAPTIRRVVGYEYDEGFCKLREDTTFHKLDDQELKDMDEQDLQHNAATKIQKVWRGYRARKQPVSAIAISMMSLWAKQQDTKVRRLEHALQKEKANREKLEQLLSNMVTMISDELPDLSDSRHEMQRQIDHMYEKMFRIERLYQKRAEDDANKMKEMDTKLNRVLSELEVLKENQQPVRTGSRPLGTTRAPAAARSNVGRQKVTNTTVSRSPSRASTMRSGQASKHSLHLPPTSHRVLNINTISSRTSSQASIPSPSSSLTTFSVRPRQSREHLFKQYPKGLPPRPSNVPQ